MMATTSRGQSVTVLVSLKGSACSYYFLGSKYEYGVHEATSLLRQLRQHGGSNSRRTRPTETVRSRTFYPSVGLLTAGLAPT